MRNVRDAIAGRFSGYVGLLRHTAGAVAAMLEENPDFPKKPLEDFFIENLKGQSEVEWLYFANNIRWGEPGSRFVINDRWIPETDYDQTQRGWFTGAKKAGGKAAYTDPYIEAEEGKLIIALSMTVFDRSGKDIGVVCAEILIEALSGVLESVRGTAHEVYLLDKTGAFIIHSDKEAVMRRNFFTDYRLEGLKASALSGETFSGFAEGMYLYTAAIPDSGWRIVSIMPEKAIFAKADRIARLIVSASLILLIAAGMCAVFFAKKMLSSPIQEIQRVAGLIAEMDFSAQFARIRNDEIGDVQLALTKIRDNLKKTMDQLKEHLDAMTAKGNSLNEVIADSSQALSRIGENMEKVQNKTEIQNEAVHGAEHSAEEIFETVENLKQAVQIQASHIAESSGAIGEMVANIAGIRQTVAGIVKTTSALGASSAQGHDMLLKLSEEIGKIQEQSGALRGANKTISDIAAQTNILAMNAAIEASHAGESGKGFAVVAGEIRKLAELSARETDSVSREILQIEREIGEISAVSAGTVQAMDKMFREIGAMDNAFAAVNNAVDEQAQGGSEILSAIKGVQETTRIVQDGADAIFRRSRAIQEEIRKLSLVSSDLSLSVEEVRSASGSIACRLADARNLA
jgi:methyl-accepting chemotaxis protein